MQVGKRGREHSDTRARDLSARNSIHTQYNARIGTHSKASRTPLTVSPTVLYDAILLPHGTACAEFNCTGETRATYRKPQTCEKTSTNENMRTPGRYRSTNDSVLKSERSSLARGSDLPKCHSAHTSVGDIWRGPARRLIKKHFAAG